MTDDSQSFAPKRVQSKSRARVFTPEEEQQIREQFHYNPTTGEITWRIKRHGSYRNAGETAESISCSDRGYARKTVCLNGRNIRSHRVAFFLMTGRWVELIDHADGDATNNKIENLREATRSQNLQNSKCRKNSVTGLKGVTLLHRPKLKRRFKARINFEGTDYLLGHYYDALSAHEAYASAAFFAFGEYANIGNSPLLD